jgi:hypothetical protein
VVHDQVDRGAGDNRRELLRSAMRMDDDAVFNIPDGV